MTALGTIIKLSNIPPDVETDVLIHCLCGLTGMKRDWIDGVLSKRQTNTGMELVLKLKSILSDWKILNRLFTRKLQIEDRTVDIIIQNKPLNLHASVIVRLSEISDITESVLNDLIAQLNLAFRIKTGGIYEISGPLTTLVEFQSKCNQLIGFVESPHLTETDAQSRSSNPDSTVIDDKSNILNSAQSGVDLLGEHKRLAEASATASFANFPSNSSRSYSRLTFKSLDQGVSLDSNSIFEQSDVKVQFVVCDYTSLLVDAIVNPIPKSKNSSGNKFTRVGEIEVAEQPSFLSCKILIDVCVCSNDTHDKISVLHWLTTCYENCLAEVQRRCLQSIAFLPLIADASLCACAARSAFTKFLSHKRLTTLETVLFIGDEASFIEMFKKALCGTEPNESHLPCPIDVIERLACVKWDTQSVSAASHCNHSFGSTIGKNWINANEACPVCAKLSTLPNRDNQPLAGKFLTQVNKACNVPGYPDCEGVIEIEYRVSSGIQGPNDPLPGKPYSGTTKWAYLPNNAHGRIIRDLFELAFKSGQIFSVGQFSSSAKYGIVWKNIHHKTKMFGGPLVHGYPDPGYLNRVESELRAAGIDRSMLLKPATGSSK